MIWLNIKEHKFGSPLPEIIVQIVRNDKVECVSGRKKKAEKIRGRTGREERK